MTGGHAARELPPVKLRTRRSRLASAREYEWTVSRVRGVRVGELLYRVLRVRDGSVVCCLLSGALVRATEIRAAGRSALPRIKSVRTATCLPLGADCAIDLDASRAAASLVDKWTKACAVPCGAGSQWSCVGHVSRNGNPAPGVRISPNVNDPLIHGVYGISGVTTNTATDMSGLAIFANVPVGVVTLTATPPG